MKRRKFITIAFSSSLIWAINPLLANDVTDPWKATSVEEAITALFGKDIQLIKSDKVKIKAPKIAENASSVPIDIKSDIEAKRVVILQSSNLSEQHVSLCANPFSIIGIFTVPKDSLIEYGFRIKIASNTTITVLIEDTKGNIYMNNSFIELSICEGEG